MDLDFTPREELAEYEWNNQRENWSRPDIDRKVLRQLSERSTAHGILRVSLLVLFLTASAVAFVLVGRISFLLAIPLLYVYYFFYGFWVALAHELQHKIVFARSADWLSEILFFFVQVLIWNSPRYARVSHRLHHRYTMVRGVDPETLYMERLSSRWLRKFLIQRILAILVVQAVVDFARAIVQQIGRIAGKKDRMMREQCTDKDNRVIRLESFAILLIHLGVIAGAIIFGVWELLVFITIAWQIGSAIEGLWHATEHIGRLHDINDLRLATRSIRVGSFVGLIFGGLDRHIDHHIYPSVPSRNLAKLHEELKTELPEARGIIGCWREMFAIAREKDVRLKNEYVPVTLDEDSAPNRITGAIKEFGTV